MSLPVDPDSRAFTNATLAELRASRWKPQGWIRFAVRVGARSGEQIRTHPRAAVELTALHVAFLAASRRRGHRWVATSWLTAITHLGLLGERRSIGWPNAITVTRANLPVVGGVLGCWLGLVAAASDKLDGMLARRVGPTMFGSYADSLADAAFWTWFGFRVDPSSATQAAGLAAWAVPVAGVAVTSFAKGEMIDGPRPALLRPAAALQVVLALRAIKGKLRNTSRT
jgi:hypothetical protein